MAKSFEPEFEKDDNGLYVPLRGRAQTPVSSGKFIAGLKKARKEMADTLHTISDAFVGDFDVSEIEVTASFDVKGAYLGFGVGGAASIKIKIKPKTV